MLRSKAINAHHNRKRKALVVEFTDGSAGMWTVRRQGPSKERSNRLVYRHR